MSESTITEINSNNSNAFKLKIASYVFLTFLGYLAIGLPLAILPIFIHKTLGYSELIAGIVISLQYATTFLCRGMAGKIVDEKGPKPAVLKGMIAFLLSAILLFLAAQFQHQKQISLFILIIARLATGCAEGLIGSSPINWAMLAVGKEHTSTAISFNGIASYGALAIGAPLGVILNDAWGIKSIGILIFVISILGYFYAKNKTPLRGEPSKEKKSFMSVIKIVLPFGLGLGLAGIGFGGISNFITLYYDHFQWQHAALCLTVFSVLFILCRIVFSNSIDKFGGLKVGLVSILVETIGLLALWMAKDPNIAMIGAGITGLGFSLVFPALGVVAVSSAPASNAGAALAAYALFIDLSLGVTGPLVGSVISGFGMPVLFLFCAIMVFIGLLITIREYKIKF